MECDDLAGNMRRLLVAVCGAAWLATGCATPGPSAATQGATLAHGARAVGWISGDAARDLRRRAVIGAGTSALAPGAVGYYMDVQEAKLREQLDRSGVIVMRRSDEITWR